MVMSAMNSFVNNREISFTKGEQKWDYLYNRDAAKMIYQSIKHIDNKKDSERNPKVIIFDTESGELDYVLLEVKNNVFSLNETNDINVLNFNSKFTEMLIDKNLTQGNSNDIIVLLKNNNISKEIIDYIQKKTKETRDEHWPKTNRRIVRKS